MKRHTRIWIAWAAASVIADGLLRWLILASGLPAELYTDIVFAAGMLWSGSTAILLNRLRRKVPVAAAT